MLKDDAADCPDFLIRAMPSYSDPKLAAGSPHLTQLALEMWRLGMVRAVKRKGKAGFQMFTVDNGDKQRLVFDSRRPNLAWKRPPRFRMGSPRALAELDLSDGALDGDDVTSVYGDVRCRFYSLRGPEEMAEYLWLAGRSGASGKQDGIQMWGTNARTRTGVNG